MNSTLDAKSGRNVRIILLFLKILKFLGMNFFNFDIEKFVVYEIKKKNKKEL